MEMHEVFIKGKLTHDLTAPQELKRHILINGMEWGIIDQNDSRFDGLNDIDEVFAAFAPDLQDVIEEIRCSGSETGLPCEYDRNYETCSVASKMRHSEIYVGWTYFYGGGKHGQPSYMPWIENAYFVKAEPVVVEKLVYTKM